MTTESETTAAPVADRPQEPIDLVSAGSVLHRAAAPSDAVEALRELARMLDREAQSVRRFAGYSGRSSTEDAINRCASIARQFARKVEQRGIRQASPAPAPAPRTVTPDDVVSSLLEGLYQSRVGVLPNADGLERMDKRHGLELRAALSHAWPLIRQAVIGEESAR